MHGSARPVGLDRPRVGAGGALGVGEQVAGRGPSRVAWKNVAVRLLRRMREVPREAVDEDRGAAVDDRERVAPHPQREPEPEVRGEQRVRTLARQVRRRARDADHERVERPSSSARRSSTARSSASACATDGGPPNAAATVSSVRSERSTSRRSSSGSAP